MDSKLRTPNSEPRTFGEQDPKLITLPLTLDEVLSQVQTGLPGKVLFWGERAGEISSYVAGWLAGKEIDVIVLDGANRFDPYMTSSFARKALISPEKLLKRIWIARAFTCYQMAIMIGERLHSLLIQEGATGPSNNRWVIVLGPATPFMDGDVSEREVRPLFERSLRKIEEMASIGIPFFLFQSSTLHFPFPTFTSGGHRHLHPPKQNCCGRQAEIEDDAGRLRRFMDSKRAYLMRRLFQFSNLVWKISLEDDEPRIVLEKGLMKNSGIRDLGFKISQPSISNPSSQKTGCGERLIYGKDSYSF
jgi:hypothetical protein